MQQRLTTADWQVQERRDCWPVREAASLAEDFAQVSDEQALQDFNEHYGLQETECCSATKPGKAILFLGRLRMLESRPEFCTPSRSSTKFEKRWGKDPIGTSPPLYWCGKAQYRFESGARGRGDPRGS
jgi:hypothetical protein